MSEAYVMSEADLAARDAAVAARVRTQVAAETLMAAHDDLEKVAERLYARGAVHVGTAGGVHLACFRLIELADEISRASSGTVGTDNQESGS